MTLSKLAFLLLALSAWTASAENYRLVMSGDYNNTCVDSTSNCFNDIQNATEAYFVSKGWWPESTSRLRGRRLMSCSTCIHRYGVYVCEFFYGCRRRDLEEVQTERELSGLLGECETDCSRDSDCGPGLLCADDHKHELEVAGYDKRKAYCGAVGEERDEVCFDPIITGTSSSSTPNSGLGECQFDCDSDSDCATGLLCADDHKDELAALGYDERVAYCDLAIGTHEVCYDPNKLEDGVLDEDTWHTLTLSEVLAFIEDLKAHLLQFHDDIDRLQLMIQKKGNVFNNGNAR